MVRIFILMLAVGLMAAFGLCGVNQAWAGDGCIDVEKASAKELQELKGVGPALAKKIVDYRKAQRTKATKAKKKPWNFGNWKTMMKVRGVGDQICADNLNKVCFSGKRQKACPKPVGKAPAKK